MTALAERAVRHEGGARGRAAAPTAVRDRAVRTASRTVVAAALAVIVLSWATGGGLADLEGWASGLTSLGRLTGVLASLLMLVQVLLMARVPVLERAFGQDRLAVMHGLVGFTSFTGMIAHVGLITWGYAAGDLLATPGRALGPHADLPRDAARRRRAPPAWSSSPSRACGPPGSGCATSRGTCCTSTPTWASGSRCPTSSGPARSSSPPPRAPCSGGPPGRSPPVPSSSGGWRCRSTARCTIASSSPRSCPEGDGCVSVYLTGEHLAELDVRAGQFLTWRFLAGTGWMRAHPFSLSAAPDGRSLRITVKDLGDGTAAVPGLCPGTRVLIEGPYGRLTDAGPHLGPGRADRGRESGSPRCAPWPRSWAPTRAARTSSCCTASPVRRCSRGSSGCWPGRSGSR